MTLDEIKAAVDNGHTVHWSHDGYEVVHCDNGEWLIHCLSNSSCIGLTWQDGTTMNGKPEDFFIGSEQPCPAN